MKILMVLLLTLPFLAQARVKTARQGNQGKRAFQQQQGKADLAITKGCGVSCANYAQVAEKTGFARYVQNLRDAFGKRQLSAGDKTAVSKLVGLATRVAPRDKAQAQAGFGVANRIANGEKWLPSTVSRVETYLKEVSARGARAAALLVFGEAARAEEIARTCR